MRPFEQVVTEHGRAVYRVCAAVLGHHDAEDAWVETFVSALRAYPDLSPNANLRAWLVTIAHHKAIDSCRARARRPRPTPDAQEAEATEQAPPQPDPALMAAVRALPEKQRLAVTYRYLGDLAYAEVASLLGNSEAAARRAAADGIAALRAAYRPSNPDRED